VHVLLDEEPGVPSRLDGLDHREDAVDDQRGELERWLVEHEEPELRHEAPRDGEHLLLAAGAHPRRQPLSIPPGGRAIVRRVSVLIPGSAITSGRDAEVGLDAIALTRPRHRR
jgi:hypothetical protein